GIIGSDVYERSLDQTDFKRVAFRRSKKRVLLIDHTKFDSFGTYRSSSLSDYDLVVTDAPPPELEEADKINFIY
ncbi:MAG: DeoR/GlpR transcriptional regulator, partial [Clostridia bacterium]|nr:DeoR/GlpR transcriptional regulator [Clostridia bacterium]